MIFISKLHYLYKNPDFGPKIKIWEISDYANFAQRETMKKTRADIMWSVVATARTSLSSLESP